jgi:DNA helicase-2/ATP-dependent DNA helicase PcrA
MLQFASNLPLSPAGDSTDERLRLFYVALTRAKNQLVIVSARESDNGKSLAPIGALAGLIEPHDESALDTHDSITAAQTDWRTPLFEISTGDQQRLLKPTLERYKLSPTHLTNYLDVAGGGPEMFLLNNLLRFPQAMSPSAAFGSAIHSVLQRAHQHLSATEKRKPIEDILKDFGQTLGDFQLSELDRNKYTDRGYAVLTTYFEQRYDSFTPTQLVERNFANANVHVGDAVLTGIVDLLDIDRDEKTVFITDYKTGKAVNSWKGKSEYEKIKMHHYEQQLMFYKLLIENSGQFTGYTVTGGRIEFVEPDERGEILLLDYDYSDDKIAEFIKIVEAVWRKIQGLDFTYEQKAGAGIKEILEFENSLINSH